MKSFQHIQKFPKMKISKSMVGTIGTIGRELKNKGHELYKEQAHVHFCDAHALTL